MEKILPFILSFYSLCEIVNPGEFLNCKYKFNTKINGKDYKEFNFTGLKRLFEGRTLATFINGEDFEIFSITHNGSPSCIHRIPKENEGSIFIDSGSSKWWRNMNEVLHTDSRSEKWFRVYSWICFV